MLIYSYHFSFECSVAIYNEQTEVCCESSILLHAQGQREWNPLRRTSLRSTFKGGNNTYILSM